MSGIERQMFEYEQNRMKEASQVLVGNPQSSDVLLTAAANCLLYCFMPELILFQMPG